MADLNAYFKSIIDQDREAVVICDLNHIIIYMNQFHGSLLIHNFLGL